MYSHCRPRPIDCCIWGQLTSHWTGNDVFTTGVGLLDLFAYDVFMLIKYGKKIQPQQQDKIETWLLLIKGAR